MILDHPWSVMSGKGMHFQKKGCWAARSSGAVCDPQGLRFEFRCPWRVARSFRTLQERPEQGLEKWIFFWANMLIWIHLKLCARSECLVSYHYHIYHCLKSQLTTIIHQPVTSRWMWLSRTWTAARSPWQTCRTTLTTTPPRWLATCARPGWKKRSNVV